MRVPTMSEAYFQLSVLVLIFPGFSPDQKPSRKVVVSKEDAEPDEARRESARAQLTRKTGETGETYGRVQD